MAHGSAIEWTESTWNPVTGCSKVSPGCKHCYAERMAKRLQAMGQPNYEHGFRVATHERALELPLGWKKPQMVFVNSMSDLFHDEVPEVFIRRVFDVMRRASWHTFQILTKRAERMETLGQDLDWPTNVWMGVSVESRRHLSRLDHLRRTPAHIRFVSFEPLLEALGEFDLDGVCWAIVGGESGPGARLMNPAWATEIRDQCQVAQVPFFFKQWGGKNKKKAGRILEGRTWDEVPVAALGPPAERSISALDDRIFESANGAARLAVKQALPAVGRPTPPALNKPARSLPALGPESTRRADRGPRKGRA